MTEGAGSSCSGPWRVAIIGAGLISDLHVAGIRRVPHAQLVAIVDTDRSRAESRAAQHGIPGAYEDATEMLQALRPDVVHVLTPPSLHRAVVVEALHAGAHVYVEKPLAVSLADCDAMAEAARASGTRLCVGHSLVFDPLMRQALGVIASGRIGSILHASASYCFDPRRIPGYNSKAWYRRLPGGFVEDLAAHPASLLLRVIGNPQHVSPYEHTAAAGGSDGVAVVMQGERATGTLYVSLSARPEDVTLEVRGTEGFVTVNFSTMVVSVQRHHKLPRKVVHGLRNLSAARDFTVQTVTNTVRFALRRMDTTKGIHTLVHSFYTAIGSGGATPVGVGEGREVVRVLRAIWPASAQTQIERPRSIGALPGLEGRAPSGGRVRSALVTGATGFIGMHLVNLLADRGVRVRALARDEGRARKLLQPNVEVLVGDFAEPATCDGLAEGMDTVFHLASVMTGATADFEQVDLAGTRRLIAEAGRAGVGRFVFTSTLGAYALAGLPDGSVVTEAAIDDPDRVGNYARAKLLIERMLQSEHDAGRFEVVVARPGLVFGPGTSPFLEHLPHLGSLRGDRYVVFGDGNVPLALTYVANTVEGLWLCATVPAAAGQTFTLVDDDLPTQRQFIACLAELTGRPLEVMTIPRAGAYLIGGAVEALSAMRGRKPPTTRRLLVGKTIKLRFDNSRAKRILGWSPLIGWEEGLRRAVAAAAGMAYVHGARPPDEKASAA